MNTQEFQLGEVETTDSLDLNEPLNGDEKRALKTARDFLGGQVPAQGLRISIFRTRPAWVPGGGGWLETVDFSPDGSEFSLEGLREAHGGGTFVLKVLNEKGKFLAAQTVKIAGDPIHQGRRITQQMVEAALQPPPPVQPHRDSEMSDLIKALLANSSKAQRDSFDLLVSLWSNQNKPAGQPTGLDDLAKMFKLVDEIRGPQQPQEDSTIMGMMGILGQFMAAKQGPAAAPGTAAAPPQRPPMKFSAPRLPVSVPTTAPPIAAAPNPVPVPVPVSTTQSQHPAQTQEQSGPQQTTAEGLGDYIDDDEPDDIADDIASWDVEDIVGLIADVMAKLPEEKTLALMEKMKTA